MTRIKTISYQMGLCLSALPVWRRTATHCGGAPGRTTVALLALAMLIPLAACGTRQPGPPVFKDPYPPVGVVLAPRERGASRPTRLSNGKVTLRPRNDGLPFLFGLGDATGKASAVPLVNGVTPSVSASTPSDGVVPGQNPV